MRHRSVPWIFGILALLATLVVWGGITPVAVYHDEAAYLLQAAIFSGGRWVGPTPPIPAFFEQFHVLLAPGLIPKYPPGFALALIPGSLLHLPALVPLLLTAITAVLAFTLARRVAGVPVACLAAALWIASPGNLRFRAGYFAELMTSALWLAGWLALLEWRGTGHRGWLLLVAACAGASAITRPLTALVFTLPVGVVVLRDMVAQRSWRQLPPALAIGLAFLAIMLLHNRATTGSWRTTPYSVYTTQYLPFDRMGFGLDSTPPQQALPPDMQDLSTYFGGLHARHTMSRLPVTLEQRGAALLRDATGMPALAALALVIAALVTAPAAVWVATATTALLLLAHLPYAHFNNWTLYYLEAFPVVALLVALGLACLGRLLVGASDARLGLLLGGTTLVVLCTLPFRVIQLRDEHRSNAASALYFDALLREVPDHSIVFVRYGPHHVSHYSLIQNPANYEAARSWVVYDRGAGNASLMSAAPDRSAWLYDEATGSMSPIAR